MFYRQSITLFGIVLPLVAAGIVVGIAFYIAGGMKSDFADKQKKYSTAEQGRIGAIGVETMLGKKRQYMELWKTKLGEETKSAISGNLRKIQETLPGKEFQPTAFEPMASSTGFGPVSAQKSSQIRLGLRGTFRTVQRAFLELETRMPQLQLTELKMDPSPNQTSLLNFEVIYTAWEN
ncbi:hypothetical protein KBB96_02850 [Luteolibacter ambystomatis]|uniref:Uncharacterized protein n=1 Tax=Luteolibacter ambystomatis TaxID=2824561 RepID=A0A975PFW6_9BACT|nr:hypothetical protein [Luteolibacter ambystomatis]QUE51836.1 hypothetical protein KBB96_02850 [Luteolibacter ambystomatis]